VTLGSITAGTGHVAITAGANIVDGRATPGADITASGLILKAGGGIGFDGSTLNALETSVITLSLSAGTAGAYLSETDAVTVDTVSVSVKRVDTSANASTPVGSSAAVTQEDLISAGKLVLISTAGDITVNAGTSATVGVQTADNLLLQAAAGSITLGANVANSAGNTSVSAAGSITQNANITASAADQTIELIAGSSISMGVGATMGTNNAGVLLNAAGSVTLGSITAGTGHVAITAGANIVDGRATPGADITASGLILKAGQSVGSAGNPLETAVDTLAVVTAADGIYLSEFDSVSVNSVSVGTQRVDRFGSLSLQVLNLSDLTSTGGDGSIELVAGGRISLNDGTPNDGASVSAQGNGNILIYAQGAGADVLVHAKVISDTGNIHIQGTRTVTVDPGVEVTSAQQVNLISDAKMLAKDTSSVGDLTIDSPILELSQATVLTAGSNATDGVAGSITITGAVTGQGSAGTESLLLLSENDVLLKGIVSGIDAITVVAVRNVTFNESVAVAGSMDIKADGDVTFDKALTLTSGGVLSVQGQLAGTTAKDVTFRQALDVTGSVTIHATGIVRFDQALSLTDGGALEIRGASSVVFANGASVKVDGNLTIDAQSLAFLGGVDSLSSSKSGSVLTLKSTAFNDNVMIGSSVGLELSGALNLTTRDVLAIGSNFAKVVIGEVGLGAITLAGDTDLTSMVGAGVELRGDTITVTSSSGGVVQVPGSVSLSAAGNIVLSSGISTSSASRVALSSSAGAITMGQGARLDSKGGDVDIAAAGDLAIGLIDARSADLNVRGVVTISAGAGGITDANKDNNPDIFAKAVDFSGYGPTVGGGGDVLEAVADVVHISVPQGVVVRDTGANGSTSFNVMSDGKLYQQIVVQGSVTRVTEDPTTLLQKSDSDLIAAGLPPTSSLLRSPIESRLANAPIAPTMPLPVAMSGMAVSRYLSAPSVNETLVHMVDLKSLDVRYTPNPDLLSDNSYGIATRLQQSYILGTPGEQPFISGLDTFSQDTFEYWVDTLSL
jgi:hypothetical protein